MLGLLGRLNIISQNYDEHLNRLDQEFIALKNVFVSPRRRKCELVIEKIRYMSHIILLVTSEV